MFLDINVQTKEGFLKEISRLIADDLSLEEQVVCDLFMDREELSSTGIGKGIAIPHIRCAELEKTKIYFAKTASPIDFESIDGESVDIFFCIVAPHKESSNYLKVLANLSKRVRQDSLADKLRLQNNRDDIEKILTELF